MPVASSISAAVTVSGGSIRTTRSAVLANVLETEQSVDLNGVMLLSQILSFANDIDAAQYDPGVDQPYALALPTYAATAWYHHKLPNQPAQLEPFLHEVEQFAMTDYTVALAAGSTLDPERRKAIIAKLHDYTGLPESYIDKADLRVFGGEFEKTLQDSSDTTTGRLDSRFSGPAMDPLEQQSAYDPQSAAISSAYVSMFNDYARRTLAQCEEQGAVGFKIFKSLGLMITLSNGELLTVDDPRLDVVFDAAADHHLPVLIHTGDPVAFFQPATPDNERYAELSAHPGWAF